MVSLIKVHFLIEIYVWDKKIWDKLNIFSFKSYKTDKAITLSVIYNNEIHANNTNNNTDLF